MPNFAKTRGLPWTRLPHIFKLGQYPKDGPIKVLKEGDDFLASPINKLFIMGAERAKISKFAKVKSKPVVW